MNLRLPLVAGVVAAAAAAAILRGGRPNAPAAAPLAVVTAAPPASRSAGPFRRVVVYVVGNVVRGGVYTLPAGSRAVDALHAAGGVTAGADPIAVNLAKPLADGEELVFAAKGSEPARAARSRRRLTSLPAERPKRTSKRRRKRVPAGTTGAQSDNAPDEVIDVNVADESALETLPGIGPALAERITSVRRQSGPYGSLDDLLDVNGMTQSKLDAIAPYVSLHTPE